MMLRLTRPLGLALLACAIGMAIAVVPARTQQSPKIITPPLSIPQSNYYQQHPQEFQQLRDRLSQSAAQASRAGTRLAPGEVPAAGAWTTLTNIPNVFSGALQNPLLLTDGTVIAQDECAADWWKLTPDNTGSYINGTWTQIGSLPSGYFPLFYGSGVLPDGRVIIEGGEYNNAASDCGNGAWTNKGAIYDPVANAWTAVSPPSGWSQIGDAAGIVLDNGAFMQSDCCDSPPPLAALLNAGTLTWTSTGSSKLDRYDEEGFAKLANGKILDVDAHTSGSCSKTSELYNPGTGAWSATGSTIDQEADCSNPANDPSYELGPLVMGQNGTAVIFPGVLCGDKANTSCANQSAGFVVTGTINSYNVGNAVWSSVAVVPTVGNFHYSLADAPAAVLPDGNILFAASPDYQAFVAPTHYFEMTPGGIFTQVGDTADASSIGSFEDNFLLLPTGQVLDLSQAGNMQIYTPLAGSFQPSWQPVITSVPGCVAPGATYLAKGTQLNGLTEGTYYGDDVQAAVNFPLVKIVNNGTGDVFYARTFNHSTRSIAPGVSVTTSFKVASATETGASTLYAVGAGIPSAGTPVTVSVTCPGGLTDTHDFNGDGKSDILWRNTSSNVAAWLMNGGAVSQSAGLGTVTSAFSAIGQHDFNGDGKADIVWRDTSGNISMWFLNGAAVSSTAAVGNLTSNWALYGTGDLNGDGKGDLLWRDSGTGTVAVWFMNGATVASTTSFGAVGSNWTILGDATGGILWRDTAGDIALWGVQNGQVTSSNGLGTVTSNFVLQGAGDFNGDGAIDLLWRDTNTGTLSIWFTNGVSVTSAASVGILPSNWNVVQVGDYNGDARSDILLLDSVGDVAVWLMNGSTVSSSVGISNVGTTWQVQNVNDN